METQIDRIGHLGILVSDFERSLNYYTEVLGCKVTNILQRPDGSGRAFLCFDKWHHDFVIATAPAGVDVTKPEGRERLIQQISFVVKDRDAFLDALAHLHSHCIELVNGPVIHGPEGGQTENILGSGSHAIYFLGPDGNREEFPRPDIATALKAYTSR